MQFYSEKIWKILQVQITLVSSEFFKRFIMIRVYKIFDCCIWMKSWLETGWNKHQNLLSRYNWLNTPYNTPSILIWFYQHLLCFTILICTKISISRFLLEKKIRFSGFYGGVHKIRHFVCERDLNMLWNASKYVLDIESHLLHKSISYE